MSIALFPLRLLLCMIIVFVILLFAATQCVLCCGGCFVTCCWFLAVFAAMAAPNRVSTVCPAPSSHLSYEPPLWFVASLISPAFTAAIIIISAAAIIDGEAGDCFGQCIGGSREGGNLVGQRHDLSIFALQLFFHADGEVSERLVWLLHLIELLLLFGFGTC